MPDEFDNQRAPEVIAVLGGGAMGTACATVLAQNRRHSVRLWVRNPTFATHIDETRENSRLLPGVRLPDTVQVSDEFAVVLQDATIGLICIPTKGIRSACELVSPVLAPSTLLVSAVKGIEVDTLSRPSQILQELLGNRPVVALGGPCHAEELARGKPTSVVAACDKLPHAERVRDALSGETLRVYSNADLQGVELGGALKNVIAIAAGICDGLQLGDNAKAGLITRGLTEMTRFCRIMSVAPETLYGLAGIGDLIATCGSQHSRNRHVGDLLGQGWKLTAIEDSMNAVAEGVLTARSVRSLAQQHQIEMPIVEVVCHVLFDGRSPQAATEDLMQRPLRAE
jgi:glycerol-3-phosphate dehydrogenase (NAD(P)+)